MPNETQLVSTPPPPGIQHRVHAWVSLKTHQAIYGIQRRKEKGKWVNCAANGRPLLYASPEIAKRNCDYLTNPTGPQPDLFDGLAAL